MSSQNLPLQVVIINEVFFFWKSEIYRDQKDIYLIYNDFSLEGCLADKEFQTTTWVLVK